MLAYAGALTRTLAAASAGELRAAYLHGSAALGGWVPGRSDVDMLCVMSDSMPSAALEAMGAALAESASGCPGRELECSVVTATQAAQPAPPWPFALHVVAGAAGKLPRVVRPGGGSAGDTDLLMHYAVCRAAGWPVCGPPAAEFIGVVPRRTVLGYLADELHWGLAHASEPYAVLNACRALVYLAEGRIVSKVAGGEAALRAGTGLAGTGLAVAVPAVLVRRALAQQRGTAPDHAPGPDAVSFVVAAAESLHIAARQALG